MSYWLLTSGEAALSATCSQWSEDLGVEMLREECWGSRSDFDLTTLIQLSYCNPVFC